MSDLLNPIACLNRGEALGRMDAARHAIRTRSVARLLRMGLVDAANMGRFGLTDAQVRILHGAIKDALGDLDRLSDAIERDAVAARKAVRR